MVSFRYMFSVKQMPATGLGPSRCLLVVVATLLLTGCTGGYALARRDTAGLSALTWFSPVLPGEQLTLARWASGVGPPVVRSRTAERVSPIDTLCVISWNTAIGSGNLVKLVEDVRREQGPVNLLLLLQEVYRGGPEVPTGAPGSISFAGKLGSTTSTRLEVEALAEALGLNLYYVPSMRNGAPGVSDEDRGNAILSSLPLQDLSAMELPFERQRRVAVAATVSGASTRGKSWRLRVVSSHLDNRVGARRGWFVGGEFARVRQARALLEHVRDDEAVVLGGDFNTWFGFREPSYAAIAHVFPDTEVNDRRPTFMGVLRLDHLFFRLPDGWSATFRRADSRYGSDHYPLIGSVTFN
jgi:endonuclease/exonuclease/phosphatase family metal-dependent hydrolase